MLIEKVFNNKIKCTVLTDFIKTVYSPGKKPRLHGAFCYSEFAFLFSGIAIF